MDLYYFTTERLLCFVMIFVASKCNVGRTVNRKSHNGFDLMRSRYRNSSCTGNYSRIVLWHNMQYQQCALHVTLSSTAVIISFLAQLYTVIIPELFHQQCLDSQSKPR